MTRFLKSWLIVSCVVVLGACSDDSGKSPPDDDSMDGGGDGFDAGKGGDGAVRHDAAAADGGITKPPTGDAALGDGSAPVDASSMDSAVADSGTPPVVEDAGQLDSGKPDAGHDAATADAGDASTDAGDAGDAGHDAGSVCNGATPRGCYTSDPNNDPTICPERAPEAASAVMCSTPLAGCTYHSPSAGPTRPDVTCVCFGLTPGAYHLACQ